MLKMANINLSELFCEDAMIFNKGWNCTVALLRVTLHEKLSEAKCF
jgi:hypothetical protein